MRLNKQERFYLYHSLQQSIEKIKLSISYARASEEREELKGMLEIKSDLRKLQDKMYYKGIQTEVTNGKA